MLSSHGHFEGTCLPQLQGLNNWFQVLDFLHSRFSSYSLELGSVHCVFPVATYVHKERNEAT
jgi:hypothetical protein